MGGCFEEGFVFIETRVGSMAAIVNGKIFMLVITKLAYSALRIRMSSSKVSCLCQDELLIACCFAWT